MIDIREVQEQLRRANLDGWLLYDFQGLNPIAKKLVGLQAGMLTRRWYFWIPKQGEPCVLCHRIEQFGFTSLNTRVRTFKSWQEMIASLKQMLEGHETIAMEYSPLCSIPYVSRVDAGTVELTVSGSARDRRNDWDLDTKVSVGGGLAYNRQGLAAATGRTDLDPFYGRVTFAATAGRSGRSRTRRVIQPCAAKPRSG